MAFLYQHIREIDEVCFYIGIGEDKRRPYRKTNRSKFWKSETNKYKFYVKILSNNLSWKNAQEAEIQLIKLYGRRDLNKGTLVNLTDGGDGNYNYIPSEASKIKRLKTLSDKGIVINAVKVINVDTLEIFESVRKASKQYGKSLKDKLSGKVKNITPYIYLKNYNEIGEYHKNNYKNYKNDDIVPRRTQLINIKTKEIFNTGKEVSNLLGISYTTLYDRLNGKSKQPCEYMYLKEYQKQQLLK